MSLALYVLLFPQLVAGPIVRYSEIESEITRRSTSLKYIYNGIFRFIAGFSKKMLLANTLGKAADIVFALDGSYGVVYALSGAICYSIQLYLDFSAYSDMAIGLGIIFGFHFPENFNYPYLSRSITEFWRRWHISLSTWFKDYIFIPLGGSRKGLRKNIRNILIVFAATGIWHGASWTFLFWGIYHAFFLILEKLGIGRILKRLPSLISRLYVLIVVCIGFVFFRADTFNGGINVMRNILSGSAFLTNDRELLELIMTPKFGLVAVISVLFCTTFPVKLKNVLEKYSLGVISDVLVLLCFFIAICELEAGAFNPFIYFRF